MYIYRKKKNYKINKKSYGHGTKNLKIITGQADLKVPKCEILMSWILMIFLS